ncbi:hypothetical protein BDV12DRAFT_195184 [Aspergillus spectabilis]
MAPPQTVRKALDDTHGAQLDIQGFTCFFSIIIFSLAAAIVAKTPRSAPLYIAACFNLGVGVVFFIYFPIAQKTLDTTRPRPPVLYLLIQPLWFCLWGAAGPLMFIYRFQDQDNNKNTYRSSSYELDKRQVTIPVVVVVGDVQKMATACGAFGVICLYVAPLFGYERGLD